MIADLESLYRARRPEFCRVAAAIAGDRGLGEDAVQDAFAKAVRKRRTYRGQGSLEAWVWRIVVNAARDARRRRPPVSLLHDRADPVTGLNGHVEPLPLELLTERQREVLFLHYYADLDYGSIGHALGISPNTVGATLSTARGTLRRALETEVRQ
jgi:DNA-directed RNA polymerase specialized sigma24 family protein